MIKLDNYNNTYELNLGIKNVYFSFIRKKCSRVDFVKYSNKLINILWESFLSELELKNIKDKSITGEEYDNYSFKHNYTIVSIYRSAESLSNIGPIDIFENFNFGKILIQRDEDNPTVNKLYYSKFPKDIKNRKIILVDNMLATGNSLITAIKEIISFGVKAEDITILCLLSAPEGVRNLESKYNSINIFTCQMDKRINEKGYICPGLGDFGDRFYGSSA